MDHHQLDWGKPPLTANRNVPLQRTCAKFIAIPMIPKQFGTFVPCPVDLPARQW